MSADVGATAGMTDDEPEAPAELPDRSDSPLGKVVHGAMRGAIAAWAMTGMRSLTVNVGLVEEPPPRAIMRQKKPLVYRLAPKRQRRVGQELFHCGYGAVGGAAFALLPNKVHLQPWAGPLYGLGVWLAFEFAVAPLLGLSQAKKPRPVDRVALAVDHLLYGFVLSETRRRPRE
jgi:hypothetical protein